MQTYQGVAYKNTPYHLITGVFLGCYKAFSEITIFWYCYHGNKETNHVITIILLVLNVELLTYQICEVSSKSIDLSICAHISLNKSDLSCVSSLGGSCTLIMRGLNLFTLFVYLGWRWDKCEDGRPSKYGFKSPVASAADRSKAVSHLFS